MPTYGYECTACNDAFEVVQSIKDDALTTCQVCGGKLRKRIYPVGISFKGSGFYVNDYAAKPSGESKSAAAPAAAEKSDSPSATESAAPAASATNGKTEGSASTETKPAPAPASPKSEASPASAAN